MARRRRKPRVHSDRVPWLNRRGVLAAGVGLVTGGAALARRAFSRQPALAPVDALPVRPPTADADDAAFRARCIRCGLCGTVCENGCIRFFGLDETTHGALTPYLAVRHRSCTLCMRCTNICPTGALSPVPDTPADILDRVKMGRAVVEPNRCLSYLGRVCGYCHDACPFPSDAIRLTPPALPVVLDACVGCGRCVEMCPQAPTAIFLEARIG